MLTEHLKMYGNDPGKRPSAAGRVSRSSAPKPEPEVDLSKSEKRKTSSLVFLDLDAPSSSKSAKAAPPKAAPPPPAPAAASLIEEVQPEIDESLEIETTSLVEEEPRAGGAGGMLEGLETTITDFSETRAGDRKSVV